MEGTIQRYEDMNYQPWERDAKNPLHFKRVFIGREYVYTRFDHNIHARVPQDPFPAIYTMHGCIKSQLLLQDRPDLAEQVQYEITGNGGYVRVPRGEYLLGEHLTRRYSDPTIDLDYPLIPPGVFSQWVDAMSQTAPYIPYDIHLDNIAWYSPDCLLMFDYDGEEVTGGDFIDFLENVENIACVFGIPYRELPNIIKTTDERTWTTRLDDQVILTEAKRAMMSGTLTSTLKKRGFHSIAIQDTNHAIFKSIVISRDTGAWVLVQEKGVTRFLDTLLDDQLFQFVPSSQDPQKLIDSIYKQ